MELAYDINMNEIEYIEGIDKNIEKKKIFFFRNLYSNIVSSEEDCEKIQPNKCYKVKGKYQKNKPELEIKFIGFMIRNMKEGFGLHFRFEKLRYEGEFRLNKWNGQFCKIFKKNKIFFEGGYSQDKKHGYCKIYNKNGQPKFFGNFNEGKREGKGADYHNNGIQKFSGSYVEDLKEGAGKVYFENETLETVGNWKKR